MTTYPIFAILIGAILLIFISFTSICSLINHLVRGYFPLGFQQTDRKKLRV